jgi:hypothetical protein
MCCYVLFYIRMQQLYLSVSKESRAAGVHQRQLVLLLDGLRFGCLGCSPWRSSAIQCRPGNLAVIEGNPLSGNRARLETVV